MFKKITIPMVVAMFLSHTYRINDFFISASVGRI